MEERGTKNWFQKRDRPSKRQKVESSEPAAWTIKLHITFVYTLHCFSIQLECLSSCQFTFYFPNSALYFFPKALIPHVVQTKHMVWSKLTRNLGVGTRDFRRFPVSLINLSHCTGLRYDYFTNVNITSLSSLAYTKSWVSSAVRSWKVLKWLHQ